MIRYASSYQSATLEIGVGPSARVGLKFVVAPTVATNIKRLLGRINRRTVGTIKFVAPAQSPPGRITGERWRAEA